MSISNVDARILKYFNGGECFVDLGCGTGEVSQILSGRYSRALGLDINRYKADITDQFRSWEFVEADLNKALDLDEKIADGVLGNQVIEHIMDPYGFVMEIYRILKPGGIVVLTTPNIRYLKYIWKIFMMGEGPQTANGNIEDGAWDDGHIHYFTYKDLQKILLKAGFRDVKCRALISLNNDFWIRRLLNRYSDLYLIREFFSGNILVSCVK